MQSFFSLQNPTNQRAQPKDHDRNKDVARIWGEKDSLPADTKRYAGRGDHHQDDQTAKVTAGQTVSTSERAWVSAAVLDFDCGQTSFDSYHVFANSFERAVVLAVTMSRWAHEFKSFEQFRKLVSITTGDNGDRNQWPNLEVLIGWTNWIAC